MQELQIKINYILKGKNMRKRSIYLISVVVIILIICMISKNNKKENTIINNKDNNTSKENAIQIEEDLLKQSIEKTQDGIKVSDAKIIKNENNIIVINLNAQNDNEESKNVGLSIVFYDRENKEIGRNGFALGNMKPGENKNIESNCYISKREIKSIKLETKVLNIDDKKEK